MGSKLLGAAITGMVLGLSAMASAHPAAGAGAQGTDAIRLEGADRHACKGQNGCKAQGGCKTEKHGCQGQNACKGQGGCRTDGGPKGEKHDSKDKNACGGASGCGAK